LSTSFFAPLSRSVVVALTTIEDFLKWLPWYVIPGATFLLIARTRRYWPAVVAALASIYPGIVGLWDVTMETLALMAIAVVICLIIGIPLGVAAAFSRRLDSAMRPVLDAMQTVPAPIYFIPMVLFLGIGRVPATIATVIYALPPIIRLTPLGIRHVDKQAVEASTVFGSSRAQTLLKVQIPLAMPSIMTGINQTIMMALGIVVLATLLGAGGLGQEVMDALQQRSPGRGTAAGLAIVAVAMVLDRIGISLADTDRTHHVSWKATTVGVGALLVALFAGLALGWSDFPPVSDVSILAPIDRAVIWARDNLSFMTRPFNDFMVAKILVPARDLLTQVIAWPVLIFATAWVCWRMRGWKLALVAAALLTIVGLIGMWELSIITLTQVVAGA